MRPSTRLRRMLDEPEIIVLPGAYDALTARLAERAQPFHGRAQRTHTEEFYQVVALPVTIGERRQKLRALETVYNTRRPHQALGYLTPAAYYKQWLAT